MRAGIGDSGFGIREASACVQLSSCGHRVGPGPPELDARLGATRVRLAGIRAVRVCRRRSSARTSTRIRGHGGPGPTLCVHGELSTFGNPESRIPNPTLPRQLQGRGHGGPEPTLCVHGELSTYGNPESRIPNPVLPPKRQDPRKARKP